MHAIRRRLPGRRLCAAVPELVVGRTGPGFALNDLVVDATARHQSMASELLQAVESCGGERSA